MEHNADIYVDLETQELQIKTDSALNTNEIIDVDFYAGAHYKSYIAIRFADTIKYVIAHCSFHGPNIGYDHKWTDLDSEPTSEKNKIWRITEKSDHSELYIYCNDVLVLTYVYADSPHQPGCVDNTGKPDITAIQFYADTDDSLSDTASDFYRVVGNNISQSVTLHPYFTEL